MRQKLPAHRSGVSADRRNFLENIRVRLSAEEPLRRLLKILRDGFPAPWARHIYRNKNQNVFSSVRSGIFRRKDFQKMPLLTELFAIGENFLQRFRS
jgi:hypothetical protein